MASVSATASEYAESEVPSELPGEATPAPPPPPPAFPPYPPYKTEPAPPSVANTIIAGRDMRIQHKSIPMKPVRPAPKPAKPRGPKATDVKLAKRAMRAHARCLRRHGAILTDRLERMSKPRRRNIISLWREHAYSLTPETIYRLRSMLDADEPFKPDQAYEYFINLKKTKKKNTAKREVNQIKKDLIAICCDKRFIWARNATVAFAKGIQMRLSRPGHYVLADKMLRLSNIVLDDMCSYMHVRTPSRRSRNPKAKFLMEMADKITVWIDDVLEESEDRMLMMDFDEDDEVLAEQGGGFTDNFLDMMGDRGGGGKSTGLLGPSPAYLKFSGPMLEAFLILIDSMTAKGNQQLLSHGKFQQTYQEGATELKTTPDFDASDYDSSLANKLNNDLSGTAKPNTPPHLEPFMKEIVEICSNYLAQYAEYNKDKGPAFRLLVQKMKTKPNEKLYQKEKATRTYGKAATELEEAKGLESDHDDPNLSQEIHSLLSKLVESDTPPDLKQDMKETLDITSKYLSQAAVDEIERSPAFDLLIKELEKDGAAEFTPQFDPVNNKYAAAYTLKSAPGFSSVTPDSATVPIFKKALNQTARLVTPPDLKGDMEGVVDRCSNYLSAFVRDRGRAMEILLKSMREKGKQELTKRNEYVMDYATGVTETEKAPTIVPFLPVKDISTEVKDTLANDVSGVTPKDLVIAMKTLVQDVGKHLSQGVALRSGVAGERYGLNFLTAVKKSLGVRPLYKYKSYGQTYIDASEELKYAGVLESDHGNDELHKIIKSEMDQGIPTKLTQTVTTSLEPVISDASKHLAKVGTAKGKAMEYVVKLMKEEGEKPLEHMQGYMQTYTDGAQRLENTESLANDKVEKKAYESVKSKIQNITEKKPEKEHAKHLPGLIDDSAKFLAAPSPETDAEKRKVLADLMVKKGDEVVGQEGKYKMTYKEGGQEIRKAPVDISEASDAKKKTQVMENINTAIPNEKLKEVLKKPADEGAAYLSDIIKDRARGGDSGQDKDGQKGAAGTSGADDEARRRAAGQSSPSAAPGSKTEAPVSASAGAGTGAAPGAAAGSGAGAAAGAGAGAGSGAGAGASAGAAAGGKADAGAGASPTTSTGGKSGAAVGAKEGTKAGTSAGAGAVAGAISAGKPETGPRAGPAAGVEQDQDRNNALGILHAQLKKRGGEVFYKQPHTQISHSQASDWLKTPPMKVDKAVKECTDTDRLQKKFERKLSGVVSKSTPANMVDVMQDVVIESSRQLSEYFVASNYKALARENLISEMQKRGNEILVETNGAAETFFFAAQRLKKTKTMEAKEPRVSVAYYITKKLDDIIRCRTMARKLTTTMKDYIKVTADYLSELVTQPDPEIEAYVALLGEMEANGNALLIEGDITKSYKDAAAYLRQLTTSEDQINMPNASLQAQVSGKLKKIMANVTPQGYTASVLDGVINASAKLLVSYIMLQGEKTKVLKVLVEKMDEAGDNVLLRHGTLRKTYTDGADILRDKNSDQLRVPSADPVVARKIQIKLHNLMLGQTPDTIANLMDDVIEDATTYLAVHLMQPQFIQVCKCMKNVFVQCELWCDEILRRVARPCCNCSRRVSVQALQNLAPGERIEISSEDSSRAFAPGIEISLTTCASKLPRTCIRRGETQPECPAPNARRTDGCKNEPTTSYLLYSPSYNQQPSHSRAPPSYTSEPPLDKPTSSRAYRRADSENSSTFHSLLFDIYEQAEDTPICTYRTMEAAEPEHENQADMSDESTEYFTPPITTSAGGSNSTDYSRSVTAMYCEMPQQKSTSQNLRPSFTSRTPIVTTDQMADWHAMMVSLMWNVQAWRDWIQDCVDLALNIRLGPNVSPLESEERWSKLRNRITNEAFQWRQYNSFSRQLTLRLASRYENKQIVSPTRATVKTAIYRECQSEMIDIIHMFYRWTFWLSTVVKETDSLQEVTGSDVPLHVMRWNYFKRKVEEYADDWKKYKTHLSVCWEHKYQTLISNWLPSWNQPGPVWVVSACGAVPSGAVAAGICDGEVTWVARTTHKSQVLPAALYPSKHCCLVYAEGAVHHYTKYQVMCNTEVKWKPWKAGSVCNEAVKVAPGVYTGRIQYRDSYLLGAVQVPFYRCHVVIFNRPFAFNCYELLVLDNDHR